MAARVGPWDARHPAALVGATGVGTTVVVISAQPGVAPGPLPAGLNSPAGLAFGPGPTLFISDGAENVLLELHRWQAGLRGCP